MTVAPGSGPTSTDLPVTLVLRHPVPGWHSIETVFATVRGHLPGDIRPSVHVVPRRSVGVMGRLMNLRDVWRLRRRPGVLHVTGDVHYLALALPRRRTVLTVHDLGTLRSGGRMRRAVIDLLWFRLPVRAAARTTVVSAATRDDLIDRHPWAAPRVEVIPNPLPAGLVARPEQGPARPATGHPRAGRPVVLAVGVTPNKNLPRLAAAVAPLDVELVVVGAVPDAVRTVLSGPDAGVRATLTTHVDLARDELLDLYARADVVALVSTSEGFGLPVVEAQAVGVPVVASRIPVLEDVSGGAAVLVDPTDVAAIRAGLVEVLGDAGLRERLVRAGMANVARFDPTAIASRYAAVYRRVAGVSASDA